jgi:hypothetical protein
MGTNFECKWAIKINNLTVSRITRNFIGEIPENCPPKL